MKQIAVDVLKANKKLKYTIKRDLNGVVEFKNATNIGIAGILEQNSVGTATDTTGGFNFVKIPKMRIRASGPGNATINASLKFAGVTFSCSSGPTSYITKTCNPPTVTKTTALVKPNKMSVAIISMNGYNQTARNKTAAQINQKVTVMQD